ncbi:MAG: class I SAM-dependent methyltransferase [Pseudomonadota bacterium]
MNRSKNDASTFGAIYTDRRWGHGESASGPGSSLSATNLVRQALPAVLSKLEISTIVDAPCGDMNWMKSLDYKFERYVGIDIVPELIERLRTEDFPPNFHFQVGNLTTDILPSADAVFCRDCLVHLPFDHIHQAIKLFRSAGYRYLFATTFTDRDENADCELGRWRVLNMQAGPFNWPEPIELIRERNYINTQDKYRDKSLGVWEF